MSSSARDAMTEDAEQFDIAPPQAASLAESMRAFGYDVSTALADLVDNSITAGALHVWIDFHWNGAASTIGVTDDGSGMTSEQLVAAMRLGSQNPRDERRANDLGRFGLGLKTASFSQCRRVTVRTSTGAGVLSTRCWDLDHLAQVNEWQLLRGADELAERGMERLAGLPHGTAVIWQKLDRFTDWLGPNSEKDQQIFLQQAEKVRQHLAMVFHRLISGRRPIEIRLNGRSISPWDPFLEEESATQILAATKLTLREAVVSIHPFVLPHQSKISKSVHEAAGGVRGWNAHQGFYIYRNQRLLVAGDWLGFGWSKEEHYKLARIRVDTPNSLDHDWAIDVTKSRATPPPPLREELRRIAERTRADAKRVYSHRGAKLTRRADEQRILLWEPAVRHDKTFYRLNREHPLLKRVVACSNDRPALQALLRLIEETIPFPHITISGSERPDTLPGPFDHAAEKQIREVMEQAYRSLLETGYGPVEAVNRLRTIWPFELFPALLAAIAEGTRHV
jgi:hypothetical protein